nr:hypothetical protein [uncultured Cellulosilyticum sp.]
MSKFKVGDKVICNNPYLWGKSRYRTVWGYHTCRNADCYNHPVGTELLILSEGENGRPITTGWTDEDLELYVEEFTFGEVIARIKEGEVYQNSLSSISKIDGCIEVVSINRSGRTIPKGEEYTVRFETNNYKLVPQKNNYLLFEVEHQEGGKRYLFRSDCNYNLGDIVICQTSLGKSYGKIVYKVIKELTEEEFKAYKPIIKSV